MKRRRGHATQHKLPVAPSFAPTIAREHINAPAIVGDRRLYRLCALAIALGLVVGGVAVALGHMIDLFTNLAFFGELSIEPGHPAESHLGLWLLPVPIVGGLIVGLMARFGSAAIRGHGIPEAMERVLEHESRIPLRLTFLKPLSAAVAIGTGGPFGAEGPIIATGGALGSTLGQFLRTTPRERKILLAAGAAAGMAATFGSPISAILLAVELLLFELAPRSLVPVALAAATGAIVGMLFRGPGAVFAMGALEAPGAAAFAIYIALGAAVGLASVFVTEAVYKVEALFARLPLHWMWWPAIGAVAVGLIGLVAPRALGVGYDNIRDILANSLAAEPLAVLVGLKFLAWAIALGSGTSGGTLAPLFTFGGGLGALAGAGLATAFPELGIDPRVAALVGMASMFAGASRALLTSIVFAFETTRQPLGLVPLLGGASAAYLVSLSLMRHTIMTRKIAERGVHVPTEYGSDPLVAHVSALAREPSTLRRDTSASAARAKLIAMGVHALPVVDARGHLVGVVGREVLASLPDDASVGGAVVQAIAVRSDDSLQSAVDLMTKNDIGLLPVLASDGTQAVVGLITRSDVLRAFRARLDAEITGERRRLPKWRSRRQAERA